MTRLLVRLSLILLAGVPVRATELPAYFQAAFARMGTEAPRGWAYTVRTTRGTGTSVERFDPSRPRGGEWTLLERDGRAPDAAELERYIRYKSANTPADRATFAKGDIDLGSVVLAGVTDGVAEFQALFREDVSTPLLPHLALVMLVNVERAEVLEHTLRLRAPFSSGLGMRMQELVVRTTYDPPTEDRPSLPRLSESRFRGRMFFLITIEEEQRVEYADFVRVR